MFERLVLAGPAAAARNADALAEEHDAMGALGRDAPDDRDAPDAANDEGTPRGEGSERSPTPIGARRA
jgi:hypothetical protein